MTGTQSHNVESSGTLPRWDGAAYAANTAHHRATDAAFLAGLSLAADAAVLDIGCGAGDFTRVVADLVPAGRVLGIDPSPSMLAVAASVAGPNQAFEQRTAQSLIDRQSSGGFDAALSRATLHWVPAPDHPQVLAGIAAQLRPGGVVRAEFGGAGNIPNVVPWLNELSRRFGGPVDPWHFPAAGEYLETVLAAGLQVTDGWVRQVAQRRAFTRDTVLGWLTSQCLIAYEAGMTGQAAAAFRAAAVAGVDTLRRPDGSYDLIFVRLDLYARR